MRRRITAALALLCVWVVPVQPAAAVAPELGAKVIKSNLEHPWDLAFTPGGKMLVTERPGRIRVYSNRSPDARLLSVKTVTKIRAEGEAGVMGIDVTRRNHKTHVVVCASRAVQAGWRNQVLRYRLGSAGRLRLRGVILGGMQASSIHNGCAVEFGPDRKVWVTMGDANVPALAQQRSSRNGKVLRVNLRGSIPGDNPYRGSPVYAQGFRNPQGLAFHPVTDRAYSIEHGPDVHDEINRVLPGRNYGWPCWTGPSTAGPGADGCRAASEYRKPVWSSGGSTIATSGGTFLSSSAWRGWRNDLLVSTLKEQDVRRFALSDDRTRAEQRSVLYDNRWGRLRASVATPGGGAVYLSTSNGGGTDRIIRIRPR